MTISLSGLFPDQDPEEDRRRRAEAIAARDAIATLISDGPLYAPITVTVRPDLKGQVVAPSDLMPPRISRTCGLCDAQRTQWDLTGDLVQSKPGGLLLLEYQCRNCGRATYTVLLTTHRPAASVLERMRGRIPVSSGEQVVVKVGQHPASEIRPPKRLEKALGSHVAFYRKAMTSRHQGYGIGAVAYLRRIVEDTINTLLDLLRDVVALEGGREADLTRLEEAKAGRPFDEKVKLAGEVLPSHLRPGGINPFATLHDLFSSGLHRRSEEETLRIADQAIESLEYLFTQLVVHVEERKAFVTKMKGLQGLQGETDQSS